MFVAFCIFGIFCNKVVMVVNTFAWRTFQHVAMHQMEWWILTRVKNREGVDSEGNVPLPFLFCGFLPLPSPPHFAPATWADLNKV